MDDTPYSWIMDEPSSEGYSSMNENSEDFHDHVLPQHQVPSCFRCFPKLCGFKNGPIEATGLSMINFAKGAVTMSTIFLGPALLALANDAAQANCIQHNEDVELQCNENEQRVYGMKPSSLLTVIGVVSGLLSTIFLPLFGAVVDHTTYRKEIGQYSIAIVTIVKGIEIFVGPSTWFAFSVLQVVNFVLYNAHSCAIYAFTAELSTLPNEQVVYNSKFQEVNYICMLLFLIVVMIISALVGTDDVGTARISQSLVFVICTFTFGVAWKYFMTSRPALSNVPDDSTLLKTGFQKLFTTFARIMRKWYALRYFLLSIMLSEAATAAFSTIGTTFMTEALGMDSHQIGLAFLCVFVAGIPGCKVGNYLGNSLNPLRSAKLCLVVFMLNTTVASLVLQNPSNLNSIYIFCSVWGALIGWLHPTHSAIYCTIIPRGSESEMMGLYLFSGSVLSFLPPFIFTCLNEIGLSMDLGLASLNLFFAGGLIFFLLIGDFEKAVDFAIVSQCEEERSQSMPEIL